jgi:hypothetical protein
LNESDKVWDNYFQVQLDSLVCRKEFTAREFGFTCTTKQTTLFFLKTSSREILLAQCCAPSCVSTVKFLSRVSGSSACVCVCECTSCVSVPVCEVRSRFLKIELTTTNCFSPSQTTFIFFFFSNTFSFSLGSCVFFMTSRHSVDILSRTYVASSSVCKCHF